MSVFNSHLSCWLRVLDQFATYVCSARANCFTLTVLVLCVFCHRRGIYFEDPCLTMVECTWYQFYEVVTIPINAHRYGWQKSCGGCVHSCEIARTATVPSSLSSLRWICSWQVKLGVKICKGTVSWIPRKYNWRWVLSLSEWSLVFEHPLTAKYDSIRFLPTASSPPCPLPSPPSSLFLSLCLALLFPAAFLTQTVNLDDTTVKFEIWDTAGQERYHSLAPMYYRGAQAAIVVFDITNMVRSVTCFCLGGH